MEDTNRVYRIRTVVGEDAPNVIHVPLNQSYDTFEILSLKLDQTNTYKTYESDYGVIVGRVTANGGFGVPNAKVSVFIEVSDEETLKNRFLYNYSSTSDTNNDGVRYNVLPDFVDDACHQDVGTFPNKRLVLDNKDEIEIFDKYWKYTTTTNHAGDYMLFGIPTGSQQIHVDVDLSDCGILSQRPRDMIGKGYNANMFESPNKFKSSTNLNSLAQIISQDRGVYVYPYWGDVSETPDNFAITRCDINLEYKFESYAVFIGSIVTDKGSNAIGKNCTGTEQNGKMSDLIAGEGTIEMIRKTLDNKVEEFPIMGNRLIDGDGVWCYQVPMNLDYVTTDEFGNLVPTDNPEKGIATRTRARFRISLDENPNDATARKRARYLVPNNPRIGDKEFTEDLEVDYEFGSLTRDESYCDMFWNKVYTVKNYIPKLQKNNKETNRKHTGIKLINHYGDNNPMPYNALTIKLSFTYRLICVIVKIFILLIGFLNNLISILGYIPCWLGSKCIKIFKWKVCPFGFLLKLIPSCISLSSEFCDDGINPNIYYPGCGKPFDCVWVKKTKKDCQKEQAKLPKEDQKICKNSSQELYTCVENELAQQNDATSFNFYNDWVNGVLYAPLWYRKIRPKKKFFFGLFRRKVKDEWCSADKNFDSLRIMQACSVIHDENGDTYKNFVGEQITPYYHGNKSTKECKKSQCNKSITNVKGMFGVIRSKETMLGQTVYYYKPIEYDPLLESNKYLDYENKPKGEIKLLFATDIVLLGSLNECDLNGVPQFFKSLESTTYNLPSDILFTDHDIVNQFDTNGNLIDTVYTETSEMAGCDWGNKNEYGHKDGGLFYSIGCSDITMTEKSCINLIRICEYGVSLDETKQVANLSNLESDGDEAFDDLITDGFVSWDELYNLDERSMFATMNGNKLRTKLNNKNGLYEYDFRYLYPENFEGSLKNIMQETTKKYKSEVTYKNNYKLEEFSRDYYIFRMGDTPYFYDKDRTFARYENSFYFYFGLKAGKTAIEKFNSKYFAECFNPDSVQSQIGIKYEANSWCSQLYGQNNDGYLALDFSRITMPYDLLINSVTNGDFSFEINSVEEEEIYFSATNRENLNANGYKWLKVDNNGRYDANGTAVPMLDNGSYIANVTDGDGNIIEFNFSIDGQYLSFKSEKQDFKQPNNVLGDKYDTISNDNTGEALDEETNQVTRDYGGVITIFDIYIKGKRVEEYNVEITPQKKIGNWQGAKFNNHGYKSQNVIHYDTTNEIYGVGLPKGDMTYIVTVTETCNDVEGDNVVESDNVVKRKIYVAEPLPFKMFINDVDYDLIKNFNKIGNSYSDGWVPDGKISNKKANLQDSNRSVIFQNNPWFNVDNIWSADKFKKIYSLNTIDEVTDVNTFITQVNNKTLEIVNIGLSETVTIENAGDTWIDAEGVTHTATSDDIGREVENYPNYCTFTLGELLNEFTRVSVGNNVYYTWDGEYIVKDFDNNTFIANTSLYNENNIYDLVGLVNDFIDNVNNVIAMRTELPSLMKDTFYINCNNNIKDIIITVQTSDMPFRTTIVHQEETAIENSDEHTLSTNNMVINYESMVEDINIPTITYACNERFGIEGSVTYEPVIAQVKNGKKKYEKHPYYVGTTNDVRLTIPKKSNGQPLNTKKNGELWEIDEKNNQLSELFDFPLIDKILNVTYISWAFMDDIPYYKKLLSYVNKVDATQTVTIDQYNSMSDAQKENYQAVYDTTTITMNGSFAANVFNGNLTNNRFDEQTLCGLNLKLSENLIDNQQTYVEKRIVLGYEGDELLEGMLGFTNYIVDDTYTQDITQYAPVLSLQTPLNVEDETGCGVTETIYGNMQIELTDESVNNCKTGDKILEVQATNIGDWVCYSAISLKNNAVYPLNYVELDSDGLYKLNRQIKDVYSVGSEYNIFSFKMTSDYFRNGDNTIVDKRFDSVVEEEQDDGSIKKKKTDGYGTNGHFTTEEFAPVYIVAETDNHCRAISPVYDYSFVWGLLKFGKLKRKDVEVSSGGIGGGDESTEGGESQGGSGTSAGSYVVEEPTEEYKFGIGVKKGHYYLDNYKYRLSGICKLDNVTSIEVREDTLLDSGQYLFTTITESTYKSLKKKIKSSNYSRLQIYNNSDIIAIDYTGLKHICAIDFNDLENAETSWYTYIWVGNMPKDENDQEYPPSRENGGILYKNEYMNYIEFVYEKDSTIDVMQGVTGTVLGYEFLGWTENEPNEAGPFVDFSGDNLKATDCRVYFANWRGATPPPQPEYNVDWVDDNEIMPPHTFEVHFRNSDDTEDMDVQEITVGSNVSPRDECVGHIWYVSTDPNKTPVEFPYTVTEDITFICHQTVTVRWYDEE